MNGITAENQWFIWCDRALCEERAAAGDVLRRYFREGEERAGEGSYFYTRDHLGSVVEFTDAGAAIRARYSYDPYGRSSLLSGDKDSALRFTGHWYSASYDLVMAPFRLYDPDIGRWLSPDPMGLIPGPNVYTYVNGNPINRVDLLGLQASMPEIVCPEGADNVAWLCCDGSGGFAICYTEGGRDGFLKNSLVKKCVVEHENYHRREAEKKCKSCDGPRCSPAPGVPASEECFAWWLSYDCFRKNNWQQRTREFWMGWAEEIATNTYHCDTSKEPWK